MKKYLADIVTLIRIVFTIIMICVHPFSIIFWISYGFAGISDVLDGFVARKLNQESDIGAKLDSMADGIFAIALGIVIVSNIAISAWLWLCITVIIILRCTGYGIGFFKYHSFVSIHTYANKITGICIFLAPILVYVSNVTVTGIFLCLVASISSIEELIIIVKAKELDRNCKGVFKCR